MTDESESEQAESLPLYRRVPWQRIVSIAGVVVLLLVVVPFVLYAAPQLVGGEQSYVVVSGSMQPAIGPGDMILVESVATSSISTGDVITFRRQGESRPTTHRVVDVVRQEGGLAFQTAGDSNDDPDPELVEPERVVGRVMSIGGHLLVIPFVGRIIAFGGTQIGFLLLAVVPIGLFVANELWNLLSSVDSSEQGTATATGTTTADTDHESGKTIQFSPNELKLAVTILVAFLGYSAWVAYATLAPWALGTFVAVGASTVLLGGLFVLGGGDADRSGQPDDQTADGDPDVDESAVADDSTDSAGEDASVESSASADERGIVETIVDESGGRLLRDEETTGPDGEDNRERAADGGDPDE